MWRKIWLFTVRLFYRPALAYWTAWSLLYRLFFQRAYDSVPLSAGLSPAVAQAQMAKLKWRADGARELWDACGGAHWPQFCLDELRSGRPQPEGSLDCDDYASWACQVIRAVHQPALLVACWMTADGKVHGHVVCLCSGPEGLFHIGNWGQSAPYKQLNGLLAGLYADGAAEDVVGWAIIDRDLRVQRWGSKLPPIE